MYLLVKGPTVFIFFKLFYHKSPANVKLITVLHRMVFDLLTERGNDQDPDPKSLFITMSV